MGRFALRALVVWLASVAFIGLCAGAGIVAHALGWNVGGTIYLFVVSVFFAVIAAAWPR